jgi:hypothetical protein
MNKFIVNINLEIPALSGDRAIENVNEFFACVLIGGKPVKFGIADIQLVKPVVPEEE